MVSREEMLANAARAALELDWLERTSDLLREPDPGPTPFLVESLIVEQASEPSSAMKIAKTYASWRSPSQSSPPRSVRTVLQSRNTGPVVLFLEESGRAAYHRRLDRLSRGYAFAHGGLSGLTSRPIATCGSRQPLAVNLLDAGQRIMPRAFFLDLLARLKGATVDESSQREIGPVLDFMRLSARRERCRCRLCTSHRPPGITSARIVRPGGLLGVPPAISSRKGTHPLRRARG